jgi:hypothetical protein
MGLGRMTSNYLITHICINQTTIWLMHTLNTFGARTSHGQPWIHKIHHGPDLGEATTFSLVVFSVALHGGHIQMAFWLKFPRLGLPWLWGPITSCENLWLQWGLKQSCSPCCELFNGMSHVACTQGNWVDSWLLVLGSQIANLTLGLSFDHNLCFRCPNESCKPILDIYISIAFQW